VKILADESVDRQIVDALRRSGHQVLYVAEMEPGISDESVLALVVGPPWSRDALQ